MNPSPRVAALFTALAVVLAGCGVAPQRSPVSIDVAVPTPATPASPTASGLSAISVYLVRDGRLEAVPRSAPSGSTAHALDALGAGPSREESGSGLRSAIPTDSIRGATAENGVVVVDVSDDFVATSGTDQLLAVAQLVWTITELTERSAVRLTTGGEPVEVPTDRGLSSVAVARDDYASVAPNGSP